MPLQHVHVVDVQVPAFSFGLSAYYLIAPAEASSNLARYDGVRYGQRRAPENGSLDAMYEATVTNDPEFTRRAVLARAVETVSLHGLEGLKHMDTAIVPGIYDRSLADEDIGVSTEEAFDYTRQPWSVQAIVRLPVFTGLARERQVETAKVQRHDAELRVRAEELRLIIEASC